MKMSILYISSFELNNKLIFIWFLFNYQFDFKLHFLEFHQKIKIKVFFYDVARAARL